MTNDSALTRICTTCGNDFLLTEAEREFRLTRNLATPETCPVCRGRERLARNAELIALYEGSGSREFAAAGGSAARTNGRRRDRGTTRQIDGPRQMYNTVCAECGAETQVPFVPRGDRPVYCRDCFNARNGR
jgi:CxxC-x17-CxxC domain-containing protein